MKELYFRPLRRIKKTGKIAVASYMQWYKVKCADYNQFSLKIDNEYLTLPPDEYVYNHKGDRLFWRDYNPADIPVYYSDVLGLTINLKDGEPEMDSIEAQYKEIRQNSPKTGYATVFKAGNAPYYSCMGLDCQGTPAFSHGTEKGVTNSNLFSYDLTNIHEQLDPMKDYEPLTVKVVRKWFGWWMYNLENAKLSEK